MRTNFILIVLCGLSSIMPLSATAIGVVLSNTMTNGGVSLSQKKSDDPKHKSSHLSRPVILVRTSDRGAVKFRPAESQPSSEDK